MHGTFTLGLAFNCRWHLWSGQLGSGANAFRQVSANFRFGDTGAGASPCSTRVVAFRDKTFLKSSQMQTLTQTTQNRPTLSAPRSSRVTTPPCGVRSVRVQPATVACR